ncbi:MAG: DivIVA domain-containing protein [Bacilli bacterium]|jgi:DivIVA domain-containing protein
MKLLLSSKDVLNKQFTKNVKGYDPLEVDTFLDLVLKDYKVIDNVVINLNQKINDLKKENLELTNEMDSMKSQATKKSKQTFVVNDYSRLDNLELLKKISAYENKLYELGVDPSKIK